MKASFVLMANPDVHNIVRRLSWEFHQKFRTGTRHVSLPPHVSLKQPFSVSDLPALENYMEELASSIQPVEVTFDELQVNSLPFDKYSEYGILWISVVETKILRGLHNRINDELLRQFGDTSARFDGDSYHFHMTVMMGGQLMDIYRQYRDEIPCTKIDMSFTARELAMILYDEPMGPQGDYLCYKILPIGTH